MVKRKKKTIEGAEFERSTELKRLFNQQSEIWCRKTRLGLADLADRCGVTLQYLSHVGRYGRIPSRPILTLLAFNLEFEDPRTFFQAAGIKDPWPYEPGIGLRPRSASDTGLLSVSLDMNGFASAIREIVRSEIQPRRFEQLLGNRPLRVGLNRGQFFLFDSKQHGTHEGFFPELLRSLVMALHCEVEFIDVLHSEFATKLESGQIDCYGPIYRTAPRIGYGIFSNPFCTVSLAGIGRTRKAQNLTDLPAPKRVIDLRKRDYRISVHRDTMAHHFLEAELGIPLDRIIPCEVPEEAFERVVLTSVPRPAHLMVTDTPLATKVHKDHPTTTERLFSSADADAPPFEDTLAIRSDWPALLSLVDESIEYLKRSGSLGRLLERTIEDYQTLGIR